MGLSTAMKMHMFPSSPHIVLSPKICRDGGWKPVSEKMLCSQGKYLKGMITARHHLKVLKRGPPILLLRQRESSVWINLKLTSFLQRQANGQCCVWKPLLSKTEEGPL